MKSRTLALFLALVMLFPALFSGCGNKDTTEDPGILGNRYTGSAFAVPEGNGNPQGSTPIRWDESTGAVTYLLSEFINIPQPDNTYDILLQWTLVTANEDAILREEVLPLHEHASIAYGWIKEDAFVFCFTIIDYDNPTQPGDIRDYYLGRYDRNTGEVTTSESVTRFFDPEHMYAEYLAVDADGTIFLGGAYEVLVFSPDFVYLKTIRSESGRSTAGLGVTEDGSVCVVAFAFEENRSYITVSALDKENGTAKVRFRVQEDSVGSPRFGGGRDLYYCNDRGVWGVTAHEDGSAEVELLMDYASSNVSWNQSQFIGARDEDHFLFTEIGEADGRRVWSTVLYSRAEDIDLSDIVTLNVAYCYQDSRLSEKIVTFNKAHPEIRLLPTDYSQYNTAEDPEAGVNKLALDMTTGVFQPDIVVAPTTSEPIRQITAKKLYRDLAPYLSSDDLLNYDNLFGAIRRTFDDGEGGTWGVASSFELMTFAARRDMMGDYADRGYWSFTEMVDYIAALPEDVAFCILPCREMLFALLFNYGGGGEFIDREAGTCSFDSPAFKRYLELALTMPSLEEAEVRMNAADPDEAYLAYFEGKTLLRDVFFDAPEVVVSLPTLFGTDDWTLIGIPTAEARDGAGIVAQTDNALVITSFCEAPDDAFAFLRSFFEGSYPMMIGGRNGLPALRSQMDEVVDAYIASEQEFVFYYDGDYKMRFGDRNAPMDPAELEKPGIVSFFTEEHKKLLYNILDKAGTPIVNAVDEQIGAIINEELSAFYAGACSADDCAARIQSRVSLWLAEHQ